MHIAQVALRATDLDRAAAFYSDLLGSQPTGLFEPPGLLFFDLDGTRLMMEGNAPSSLIYLQVDDVTTTLARMRERAEIERASCDLSSRQPQPRSSRGRRMAGVHQGLRRQPGRLDQPPT
jgi:catechol 2,3-dioxygenase-like lactoylglutathione lyase family enzyme